METKTVIVTKHIFDLDDVKEMVQWFLRNSISDYPDPSAVDKANWEIRAKKGTASVQLETLELKIKETTESV